MVLYYLDMKDILNLHLKDLQVFYIGFGSLNYKELV